MLTSIQSRASFCPTTGPARWRDRFSVGQRRLGTWALRRPPSSGEDSKGSRELLLYRHCCCRCCCCHYYVSLRLQIYLENMFDRMRSGDVDVQTKKMMMYEWFEVL